MLIGKEITKAYQAEPILDGIDIKIGNGEKVGIVGKNGCGKTTLMKILAGVENITSGNLDIQGETIGYIPQEFKFPDELVGEYLEKKLTHDWEFYLVEELVDKLEFNNFDPYQPLKTQSEGQKMKTKLIETLLTDPTILFIDEPTNHLDIEGILWFEKYIKRLDKSVIMISHDRYFLNTTVDEIWEIEKHKLLRFVGNFDNYKDEKMKLIDKWDQEYTLYLRKKAQLEKLLENSRKIKGGKKRGRAVNAAKKRIERETEGENKKEQYKTQKINKVDFETDTRQGKLMVRFENVSKAYGDKKVYENLDFEIRGKEKIWLFGPNGSGKSTLVKMIMGEETPTSGEITLGANMKVGYFAQKQTHLDFEKNLLEHYMEQTRCPFGEAHGMLNRFLFDKDAIRKSVKNLSPGERARFAFAIFAYENYDMLILDEPTNHLDIETKEVIEDSLRDFEGTLLLVSHDRYFVESIGIEKMLNLKEGQLRWM